jgi:N-acetylmuramoyl-L-alanine amidase
MFTRPFYLSRWLLLLSFCLVCSRASAAELTAIAVEQNGATTEIALKLTADAEYRYFALQSPDRLVLDLSSVRAKLASKPAAGVVTNIRTGVRNGSDLRVVFDLSTGVSAEVSKTVAGDQVFMSLSLKPLRAAAKPVAKPKPKPKPVEVAKPTSPQVVKKEIKKRRPVRVVIDAGHGGKDTGAIGPSGTREKDVALSVSKRLYQILKDSPDFAPVMSRTGDQFLKLRRRMDVARNNKADAFVSVHANSFTSRNVRGGSVYALSVGGATSEHARWLAERENAADLVGGVSIQDKDNSLAAVLLDLSQTATLEASIELADNVLKELGVIGPLHKKTVQQAGFLVLKSPDIPSILVETAYISNPKEERKLRDARYQQKLANAIFRGLRDFFVANPPPGTLFAQHGGDYIVRRGDSLSVLAQRWGTTVNAIRQVNQLRSSSLEVGQQLIIP